MSKSATLYVCRPVLNADEIAAWAKEQGFKQKEPPFKAGLSQQEGMLASIAFNHKAHVVLALRHLEDCVYRAVKALTALSP